MPVLSAAAAAVEAVVGAVATPYLTHQPSSAASPENFEHTPEQLYSVSNQSYTNFLGTTTKKPNFMGERVWNL